METWYGYNDGTVKELLYLTHTHGKKEMYQFLTLEYVLFLLL